MNGIRDNFTLPEVILPVSTAIVTTGDVPSRDGNLPTHLPSSSPQTILVGILLTLPPPRFRSPTRTIHSPSRQTTIPPTTAMQFPKQRSSPAWDTDVPSTPVPTSR
jgi:hypothetical protein